MAEKKNKKVDYLIKQFAEELQKDIPVKKILLFGSYARGNPGKNSDIDVVVVSPYFSRGKYISHMQYLFRKASKVNSLLEPIPASPSELINSDPRVFLGQILRFAKVYKFSGVRKNNIRTQ